MITISACMIVRDEEKVLARCLECLVELMDELVIVDMGSTDRTKEIASFYTDKIYDCGKSVDCEAGELFLGKTSMEYLYRADPREVIDEENQQRFLQMKETLSPEIEIVRMYETNQLSYRASDTCGKRYVPKLCRRDRAAAGMSPGSGELCRGEGFSRIGELDRESAIWDSEIEIIYAPFNRYTAKNFRLYREVAQRGEDLSPRLELTYARELFMAGGAEDFFAAWPYFDRVYRRKNLEEKRLRICECVLARTARLAGESERFIGICLRHTAAGHFASEICYELGEYYREQRDYGEALLWYDSAAFESESELDSRYQEKLPRERIDLCMERMTRWRE